MKRSKTFVGALLASTAFMAGRALAQPSTAIPAPQLDRLNNAANEVQEVVVTANKREESLEKVPIAVTAVSAKTAAAFGIDDISSLQQVVPGLQIPRAFDGATPTLRGIGISFGIGPVESVVPIYVDDVYIAQPSAITFDLNNISQVEVLRGPQSTIYGRNAMAGVIDIHTRSPSSGPSADMSVGYANYNTVSGNFYGTTPITDKLKADLALTGSDQQDGWGKNLFDGSDAFREHSFGGRSKWVYTPDQSTRVTAIFDYERSFYMEGVAMNPVPGSLFPDGRRYQGLYNVDENPEGHVDSKQIGASFEIEHDLGFARLISITAVRQARASVKADEDQSSADLETFYYDDGGHTISQEFRVLADPLENKLHLIGGLFYFHNSAYLSPSDITGAVVAPLSMVVEHGEQKTASYAAFGQATYDLPYGLHLTGGVRYTYDLVGFKSSEDIFLTSTLSDRLAAGSSQTHDQAPNYKISLQKDLWTHVTAFVGYSTGFKGATYNTTSVAPQSVKPEHLDDVEGGLKAELLNRRLKLNAAAFHYKYDDLQVSTIVFQGEPPTSEAVLQNAASAENYGVDLDFEADPIDHLQVLGGLEIQHARFTSFPDATFSVPLLTGGNTTTLGNATGLALAHAPDVSGNVGATYNLPTAHGEFVISGDYVYSSRFAWDVDNRLQQRPYGLINSSLTWDSPNHDWALKVWGKNIADQPYSIYTTANVVGDEESPAPPRTYGVTVSRHF